MNKKPTILGVSASLRNARRGRGNEDLIADLKKLSTKEDLSEYLEQEAATHLKNFEQAGRTDNEKFDVLYKNLRKLKGDKGLSNSEVALSSALWSAYQLGSGIDHLSLSEYYTESGIHNEEAVIAKLEAADGIIISSPVYFGDRSSLAQTLLEKIRSDKRYADAVRGKVYAGVAVGAKRNGGQETTLIYQMLDMLNVDMFCVGNDSETTSQYGGTGLGGDVGTMPKDEYGLATAMGTGRRISRVAQLMALSHDFEAKARPKVQFWILQDKDGLAAKKVQAFASQMDAETEIVDISSRNVMRCLACDICPTHIAIDEEYRCIIKSGKDAVGDLHSHFIDVDAIIPVVYSPIDRQGVATNYQKFLERTRYLRRGDYLFSNLLTAPLILEEIGSNENMHIRAMTSMVRHHTVLSKPIIGVMQAKNILNEESVQSALVDFAKNTAMIMRGRLSSFSEEQEHLKYKPIGYVLSAVKDKEDEKLKSREMMMTDRFHRNERMKEKKIKPAG